MADLTITASSVKYVDGTSLLARETAGEAMTAGQAIYRAASDGKWYKLDCDNTTITDDISTSRNSVGVCLAGGASADDYVWVAIGGPFNLGATLTIGEAYYASANLGGIMPNGDLGSTDIPIYLGTAYTTSLIFLGPVNGITALA